MVLDAMTRVGSLMTENTKSVQENNSLLRDVYSELSAFRQEADSRGAHSDEVHINKALLNIEHLTKCFADCPFQVQDAPVQKNQKEVM